jgi:hypothetical protein
MGSNSWLGIIGHGTTGADGIEPGIHLRWQFRPELGFPLGGFQLYRRPSGAAPKPLCYWFQDAATGSAPTELRFGNDKIILRLTNGTMRIMERQLASPPYDASRQFFGSLPPSRPPGTIKVLELQASRLRSMELQLSFPFACHEVPLLFEMPAGNRINLEAYDGSIRVHALTELAPRHSILDLRLSAATITSVTLRTNATALIAVCVRRVESCDDPDAWERLGDPICLPVYYPGSPCKGRGKDCDNHAIDERLPKDPCDRARFTGTATRDLIDALRVIVADDPELPQPERSLPGTAEIDDCAAPGEPVPSITMPTVDALMMAALNPVIARVVGLYHVDQPGAGTWDYKVAGIWPPGTLWRLRESWTFDGMKMGRLWVDLVVAGPFMIRSRTRPTIIRRPNIKLGTARALAFLETDGLDWNMPSALFPRPDEGDAVEIFLPKPAGEVQIYIGQDVPHVTLRARNVNNELGQPVTATRRQQVLAAQATSEEKLIRSVVLGGNRFWIYRIAWGPERIPHVTHCGITYGHSIRAQARPPAPRAPVTHVLPGLVQKVADCQPLGVGATRDARFSVGLTWTVPDDMGLPPADVPVRYEVIRLDSAGNQELASGDAPVVIGLLPDDAPAPPYQPPPGWPATPIKFSDTALVPGTYRYRLRAIDIFGRHSDDGDISAAPITPTPPSPPAPAMLDAVMIERADSRITDAERALLPAGVDEAVRIRWSWPESAERVAPDASGFQVHAVAGVPNVLEGTVLAGATVAGDRITVTVDIDGPTGAAQLFTGRELRQGRRAFRILRHDAGTARPNGVRVVFTARVPPGPAGRLPVAGPCTIALDAVIPVEMRNIATQAGQLRVTLRSKGIARLPASGIVVGELRIGSERLVVTSIEGGATFGDNVSEWVSLCKAPEGADIGELASLLPPQFVALRLPPTALNRDYSDHTKWPDLLGPVLPRISAGDFMLLIRRRVAAETAGLSQPVPRSYVLLVDALPAALSVDQARPRRQMAFGVSCVGPGVLRSAVAPAAVLTRVYRASAAQLSAAADVPLVLPPPGSHAYAGAPNYAGKSSWTVRWPATTGWTYQVYRALHDTLFKTDKLIRQEVPMVGGSGRFATIAACDAFVTSYPDHVRAALRDLVVNATTLDRAAIEDHDYVDTLLQALASLPMNDRAFTRVNRPIEVAGAECVCVDDTLDGRAQGVYLYRLCAIGPAVNLSDLGRAMAPVWVRGTALKAAPIISHIAGGDRAVSLRWICGKELALAAYAVYRADTAARAADLRTMYRHRVIPVSADVAARPAVIEWVDEPVLARQTFFYRIVAVDGSNGASPASAAVSGRAFDDSKPAPPTWQAPIAGPGTMDLTWASPIGDLACLVQRSASGSGDWQAVSSWLARGEYTFTDSTRHAGTTYDYRLRVLDSEGRSSAQFNVLTV